MKKYILTTIILFSAVVIHAQIKVHSDGHVSLGSLTSTYGIQVYPIGSFSCRTLNNTQYSLANRSKANVDHQKHWVVKDCYSNSESDWFYVYGNGTACSTHHYTIQQNDSRAGAEQINSEEALATVLQMKGFLYEENNMLTEEEIQENEYVREEAKEEMIKDLRKKTAALSAENLASVFPDAVRTNPDNHTCIDYQAVITMLVEAVKQQQEEIEFLRMALEENGLTIPQNKKSNLP